MSNVVLDAELRAKLNGATSNIVFVDEVGNVVGRFTTHESYLRMAEVFLPGMTRAEIVKMWKEIREQGGMNAEEILVRLAELRHQRPAS